MPESGPDGFFLHVEESFGNCPKYITRRDYVPAPAAQMRQDRIDKLDAAACALVAEAITFFVASSAGPGLAADVSHRGGPPRLVGIGADGTLTIPDYAGNFFFNTLGNILIHPRAGLLFADFRSGDLLQLSGGAWLATDTAALPGAERVWQFRAARAQWLRGALPLRLSSGEASPFRPAPLTKTPPSTTGTDPV